LYCPQLPPEGVTIHFGVRPSRAQQHWNRVNGPTFDRLLPVRELSPNNDRNPMKIVPCLKGGTGHWPVLAGDSPANGNVHDSHYSVWKPRFVPHGDSPRGTAESAVLPCFNCIDRAEGGTPKVRSSAFTRSARDVRRTEACYGGKSKMPPISPEALFFPVRRSHQLDRLVTNGHKTKVRLYHSDQIRQMEQRKVV
jgi:hypothetical protein